MACEESEKVKVESHASTFSEEVVVENDGNPIEVSPTDLDG